MPKRIQPNYEKINKFTKPPNTKCPHCGKPFYVKPYTLKRNRHTFCCMECNIEARREWMSGKNNHQYGLKGALNPSWKSDERISVYGYKLIRVLDHPFKNGDDMIFEHRLVADKYLLTKENSVEINGKRYLNKGFEVHHLDLDKLNNDASNLVVLTKSQHRSLHNHLSKMIRDKKTGRIAGHDSSIPLTYSEIISITNDFLRKEGIVHENIC